MVRKLLVSSHYGETPVHSETQIGSNVKRKLFSLLWRNAMINVVKNLEVYEYTIFIFIACSGISNIYISVVGFP